MELIIASVLFIALMACWFILPGHSEVVGHTPAVEPMGTTSLTPTV
ncbi:MAG: hypothetical protein WCK70_00745 [Chloroflexales bacterium]|jgi:hypothetical protein